MKLQGRVVWITGASSGIGLELARICRSKEAKVIISSRRKEALEAIKEELQGKIPENPESRKSEESVYVLPLDLSQHETIPEAVTEAESRWGRIDILINNAGISQRALTSELQYPVIRKIMDINFIGAAELTRCVLPGMISRGSGQIAVISSIAGKFGTPYRSVYSASKMALQGYFDSLRAETAAYGITVTMLVLGGIRTNISVNALHGDGTPHGSMDSIQTAGIDADTCAERIIKAVEKGKREVTIGLIPKTRLALFLSRWAPSILARLMRKAKVT